MIPLEGAGLDVRKFDKNRTTLSKDVEQFLIFSYVKKAISKGVTGKQPSDLSCITNSLLKVLSERASPK